MNKPILENEQEHLSAFMLGCTLLAMLVVVLLGIITLIIYLN